MLRAFWRKRIDERLNKENGNQNGTCKLNMKDFCEKQSFQELIKPLVGKTSNFVWKLVCFSEAESLVFNFKNPSSRSFTNDTVNMQKVKSTRKLEQNLPKVR